MASTATKRIWYGKWECEKSGDFPEVNLLIGKREVCPVTVEAWEAFDQVLTVTGYAANSVGTQNCRPITGGTKLSLHAYGIATDIDPFDLGNGYYPRLSVFSWSKTEFTPEQVKAVEAIKTKNKKTVFRWGGWWMTGRDYMHWEVDCSPDDLATGIDWSTVAGVPTGVAYMIPISKTNHPEEIRVAQELLSYFEDTTESGVWDAETISRVKTYCGPMTGDGNVAKGEYINGRAFIGLLRNMIHREAGAAVAGITQADGDARYVRKGVAQTATFK